jgi:hypothetical protein
VYACRVSNGRVIKYDLTTAKGKPQNKGEVKMAITSELIREIFKGLENADGATLFKQVRARRSSNHIGLMTLFVKMSGKRELSRTIGVIL